MSNDCSNKLIVVGLQDDPYNFAKVLDTETYRRENGRPIAADAILVKALGAKLERRLRSHRHVEILMRLQTEFRYVTRWEPNIEQLIQLSTRYAGMPFLLRYTCWESGFRGQAVITDGKVVEHIHRVGYLGPAFLFADVTNPLVDLSAAYLEPTLARQASKRVYDALDIVASLKDILEDSRFTQSRYRAQSDAHKVKAASAGLTAMLKVMEEHAKQISFDGVFVEDRATETGQRGGSKRTGVLAKRTGT